MLELKVGFCFLLFLSCLFLLINFTFSFEVTVLILTNFRFPQVSPEVFLLVHASP
jgi:hypothetical protein